VATGQESQGEAVIKKDDQIITAWAEYVGGSGWSNTPVWVIVRDPADGSLRQECLQPDEQTAEIVTLFNVSAAAASDMREAVKRAVKKPPKKAVRWKP
jgi:hypothetical protein